METWKGWMAASAPAVQRAPTWEQWRAYQARRMGGGMPQQEGAAFSERELARLSFLRWAYRTGRLGAEHDDGA
jgi:hypothetical protein